MAAVARSGCSTVARWAESGRRTSSECGDPLADLERHGQRGGGVLGPADDEGGCGDGVDLVAQVHLADRRAAPGVALVGRVGHALGQLPDERRRRGERRRAEPAGRHRLDERLGALAADEVDPLHPALRRPEVGRGAAQHEGGDALGRVDPQPHADHARRATGRRRRPSPARGGRAGRGRRGRGRRGSTGRGVRASGRGPGGRSARRGTGGRGPPPGAPTWRRSCRWSCRARRREPPRARRSGGGGRRSRSWCGGSSGRGEGAVDEGAGGAQVTTGVERVAERRPRRARCARRGRGPARRPGGGTRSARRGRRSRPSPGPRPGRRRPPPAT